ncbi:hypothetical protein BCR39DRAFT_541913 [Naematelia encephala]|uniref:Membrane-associated, eicosanoid/glutathione metabolism protein n=1 Tax=Naematelia encephala TaxID=71784 RepID=A0A1Y2AUK5_9TREE|nr:hypothetical protein BCR39DRAFT_541913 [Naematelia encephala]
MSFLGLDLTRNYSFYAIPIAWGLAIAPHLYAVALFDKERAPGTAKWDVCNPRKNESNVKEAKLSPAIQDRFLRSEAANTNGTINFPIFIGAIIAGNYAKLSSKTLNTISAIYLISRVAYNVLYINNTSRSVGLARTASFFTGIIACFTVFVKAGNRVYDAVL